MDDPGPPALPDEVPREQVGGADHLALDDRVAQVRDAGLEVVLDGGRSDAPEPKRASGSFIDFPKPAKGLTSALSVAGNQPIAGEHDFKEPTVQPPDQCVLLGVVAGTPGSGIGVREKDVVHVHEHAGPEARKDPVE